MNNENNKKIKVCDWAGGPAIWDQQGDRVVFPIWTKNRNQQIRLVDIDNNKVITFSKVFRVLEMNSFKGNTIYGIDSPIYKSKRINFDLEKEKEENYSQLLNEKNI